MSTTILNTQAPSAYQRRVDGADWSAIAAEVDELGCALTPQLLTAADTARLIRLYDRDEAFRSTVHMGMHRFGAGEYRYFAHPLPDLVTTMRAECWTHLLAIARGWYARLCRDAPWPDSFDDWQRLLAVNPWQAHYHVDYGRLLLRRRQWTAAADAGRSALRINPAHVRARQILIEALLRAGERDQAQREFEALLAVTPPEREEELRRWRGELNP